MGETTASAGAVADLIRHLTTDRPHQLRALGWEDKVALARVMGLTLACCPECGCYLGKPTCHDPVYAEDGCGPAAEGDARCFETWFEGYEEEI